MKPSNPTMTWSNHTTLVTGVLPRQHSVLANGVISRTGAGLPVVMDKEKTAAEMVAVPSLFDLLHAAHASTAAINWPCTRGSTSIEDNFPDSPGALNYTTPRLRRELISGGQLANEQHEGFFALGEPRHDEIWLQAACRLIRTRMPSFLALHLLNTDEINHAYGPETPAGYTAVALADRFVGDIVAAVAAAGQRDNTTFIVVSDHGFAAAQHVLQPNVLFRQAGLLEISARKKITRARVQSLTLGGTSFIYFTDPGMSAVERNRVADLLRQQEGVAEVIGADRFAALGLPEAAQHGAGDLLLCAKIGYGIVNEADGQGFIAPATQETNRGFHGYLAEYPEMNALFIASGRGIKRGIRLGEVHNIDIAPTIMRLLGREQSGAKGRILSEIVELPR
jgi:predicted AlkP superfamily pyrophosphatase or phosphodiesterase